MEKCLILGGDNWFTLEDQVNEALKNGYKILNSFPTTGYYVCIIMIKEDK